MANEIEILVRSTNAVRPGFDQARADAKRLGQDMGDGITTELTASLEHDAPKVEDTFRRVGGSAGHTGGKHAGDEFVRGFSVARLNIGKSAFGIGEAIVGVFRKILPDITQEAAKLGEKAGAAMADGIASSADTAAQDVPQLFTPEGAIGAAILVAVAGALAPAIGGAIAAAVTFGVGFGFLGVGALILKNNKTIVGAFGQLKTDIGKTMQDAAQPLVVPFTDALQTIDQLFKTTLGPSFKQIFGALAPAVQPLTDAISGIAKAITPGLIADAKTFTGVFTDPDMQSMIASLGPDINAFFMTVSKHKQLIKDVFKGIIATVEIFLGVLNVVINVAGGIDSAIHWAIRHGEDAFVAFGKLVLKVLGWIVDGADNALGWIPGLGPKLHKARQDFDKFAKRVNKALDSIHDVHVKITAAEFHRTISSASDPYHYGGHAAGGLGAGLRWVGEQGRELVKLPQGSMVYPHGQSEQMATQAGQGGGVSRVELAVTGGGDSQVGALIQRLVRNGIIQLRVNGVAVAST